MQEDKEPVFDAADSLELSVAAMTAMVGDVAFDEARMEQAAAAGHSTATDLADWLVRALGLPFRRAHHVAGALVALADEAGCELAELSLGDMQKIEAAITEDVFSVLGVRNSVASRTSLGGTAPDNVAREVVRAKERFL
jgi:argininosuccinate lyase